MREVSRLFVLLFVVFFCRAGSAAPASSEPVILHAGPVSVKFADGELRYIRAGLCDFFRTRTIHCFEEFRLEIGELLAHRRGHGRSHNHERKQNCNQTTQ